MSQKCNPGICRYSTITWKCIFCDSEKEKCSHVWAVSDADTKCRNCGEDWDIYFAMKKASESTCECGSEKSGFTSHSNWCKKYEPY